MSSKLDKKSYVHSNYSYYLLYHLLFNEVNLHL